MLNCSLMKRLLLTALAVSLVGLGSSPLSICALLSSKAAECATPETESRCDRMDMASAGLKVGAAPNASCCALSQAPLPASQQNPSPLSQLSVSTVIPESVLIAPFGQLKPPFDAARDLSPPLQSFLCTFLI